MQTAGRTFPNPATEEQIGELVGQFLIFLTTAQMSEGDMKRWLEDKDKMRDGFAALIATMQS